MSVGASCRFSARCAGICCPPEGRIYVADRENHRVQVFDANGKWETQWNYLHRPNGMCLERGHSPLCYIGEGGQLGESNRDWPNVGPRVSIHTLKGELLARVGKTPAGFLPSQFTTPHGIAVDSQGNIYVGELSRRSWDPVPEKAAQSGQRLNGRGKRTKAFWRNATLLPMR
jgi:hypothetical protein